MPIKLTKTEKTYFVDDGNKRGPMTMFRVRFHPTEPKLLALCVDRRVACWDMNGEPQQVKNKKEKCVVGELLCPHEIGWVRGFDIQPRGEFIATGGSDRTLRLWKWADGRPEEKPVHQVAAHDGWVEAVAFSPDGNTIATAGSDRAVKIWSAANLALRQSLVGHTRYAADLAFTLDGRLLVSGGEDGKVIVWDTQSWQVVRTIEFGAANDQSGQTPRHSGVHRLAVSHDSRWLAVVGGEKLDLYDLASGEIVATDRINMEVAFHPAADVLAGGENEVKLWNYAADKFAPPEKDKNGKPRSAKSIPGDSFATVKRGDWSLGLCFSNDGKQVAVGKADGTVEMYEVQ
ncbi:MAG: WD40 repeat domain-containing protein [Planctomycetaceae bacterium]